MGALKTRAGKILALILTAGAVGGAAVTTLLVRASRPSPSQTPEASSIAEPVPSSEAWRDVFISGSLVNLREAASTKATVVQQVPIGTHCVVAEKADSGWWRVDCDGGGEGWTKAELLSTERPTLKPLLALAEDAKQPLKARFDAVLRATALEPEHAGARNLLWSLFAEQEWVQLESLLTQETGLLPQLHVSAACEGESSTETCLKRALQPGSSASWSQLKLRDGERLGRRLFVSAALERPREKTEPPQLWVRTGTVEGDSKALDIQVFAQSRYVPSEALERALKKLPDTKPVDSSLELSLTAVLSLAEVGWARKVGGTWTGLERAAQGLVLRTPCDGNPSTVRVEVLGAQVKVHLELHEKEPTEFDVVGVQLAEDGSVTLRGLNGETLTRALWSEAEHAARWTYSASDSFSGLFVHSAFLSDFPVVEFSYGDCAAPRATQEKSEEELAKLLLQSLAASRKEAMAPADDTPHNRPALREIERALVAAKLIDKPFTGQDDSNFYKPLRELKLFGRRVLVIEYEYADEWIGCCPDNGFSVLLSNTAGDDASLHRFARENNCSVRVGKGVCCGPVEWEAQEKAGKFIRLSCGESDSYAPGPG